MGYYVGCKHSDKLQMFFDIESRGVDFINDFGIRFEFKESFERKLEQMFFKVPKHQLIECDFVIFCVRSEEFYIHKSRRILCKYGFKNKEEHCCLRYTTISKNYFMKFTDYLSLRDYITQLVGRVNHGKD